MKILLKCDDVSDGATAYIVATRARTDWNETISKVVLK